MRRKVIISLRLGTAGSKRRSGVRPQTMCKLQQCQHLKNLSDNKYVLYRYRSNYFVILDALIKGNTSS